MEKKYKVYFDIKANNNVYSHFVEVIANNSAEACKIAKDIVRSDSKRNAFRPFCEGSAEAANKPFTTSHATKWDASIGY